MDYLSIAIIHDVYVRGSLGYCLRCCSQRHSGPDSGGGQTHDGGLFKSSRQQRVEHHGAQTQAVLRLICHAGGR
jgi:hypothetical protein